MSIFIYTPLHVCLLQCKVLELAERTEQLDQANREFEQYKLRAQSVLKQVKA